MKSLLSILAIFYFSQTMNAQGVVVPGGGVAVSNYSSPPTHLRELFRDAIAPKPHMDVSGSPFLFDNFLLARLRFWDDRVADSVLIKLNVYDNKVHFIDENGEEMQAIIAIKEITIIDKNPTWQGYVYRTGFSGGGSDFFQVLADGKKIQLLKKARLNIWESRALGEQNKKSFQYEEELYFATDNTVYVESKKCFSVIAGLMEKHQEKVRQFVTDNNTRCNKEED